MRFAKLIYSFTTIATTYLAFKFFSKKSPALTEKKVNKYQEDFSRLITELKDINIINRTFKIEIKPTILSSLKKLSAQDLTNLKNKIEPLITQAKLLLSEIEELRVNTQVNPELLNQNIAKYQNDLRLFSEILKNIKKLSNTEHNNYVTDNVNFLTKLQKGGVITYDNDSFNPNIKNIEKIDKTRLTELEEELWQLKNTAEKLCNQPDNSIKLKEKSKKLYESNLALYNKILSNIEAVKSARLNAQELIAKQEEQEAKKAEEGENKTAAKQDLEVEAPKKTAKKIAKQAAAGKVPVEGKNRAAVKPVAEELAAAKKTEEFAAEPEVLERAAEENKEAAVAKNVLSALGKRRAELNKAAKKGIKEKQARKNAYNLAIKLDKEAKKQITSAQEQIKEADDALKEAIAKRVEFHILNPNAPEFLQNTAGGPAQQDSRSGASGSWQDRAARADPRNNTKSTL